jgi:hypothetical protein
VRPEGLGISSNTDCIYREFLKIKIAFRDAVTLSRTAFHGLNSEIQNPPTSESLHTASKLYIKTSAQRETETDRQREREREASRQIEAPNGTNAFVQFP